MYRFVTCDDPKGVVECGTVRRSKSASQKMEDKINSRRTQKKSNTSLAYKEKKEEMVPKEIIEEYHSPSSFQLLEVSRGAQKLNHLMDSFSKGLSYDGQSKDIAKELLKGALDLQDSLTMLGKLQEASQYMAQLKKKQKEKPERRKFDEVGSEKTNSHLSGDHNHQLGFQRPRLSSDRSSKDCIEELRNAIRDGLARQNLLPNTSTQERTNFDRRKDSISHIPSTSSSQLSVVQSSNIHSCGSTVSEIALQKKGKGPNLIAKLMGLEDIPSKKLMQSPERQFNMEKNVSQRRPVFDIEMPKLRKPQPIIQKVDSERRTLKELLETGQFQELLKGSSDKELKSHSHQSSDFHSKQRSLHDFPPIVLIKPPRVPCLESKEARAPMVWGEGSLNTKLMLRKMKIKEDFSSRSIDNEDSKIHCRIEADETRIKRVIQEGAKDHIEVVVIPEEKEVRTIEQREGAVKAKRVQTKLEAEKAPAKRFSYEERAKDHKRTVAGAEEKEVKKSVKDSSMIKESNPATHQRQKKDTDKKVDKSQKVVGSGRKPVDREIVKTKIVSRSQDQPTISSTKLRKPESAIVTTKHHISQNRLATRKTISKLTTQTTIHNSNDQKQKEKQATVHTAAMPITDNLECREDDERIDLLYNDHSEKEGSTITHDDQPSTEEEANDSKFRTEEHCGGDQGSLCLIAKEVNDQMTRIGTDDTSFESSYQLKDLLLSSSSFINLAEELFHLNMSYPKILPASGIYDSGVTDVKLSLDYANEFIERRSLPDSQTRHLPLSYMGDSRISLSLDQLVEEICRGIETLRSYQKLACDHLLTDSLYATFEKDMRCKGVVSGIWDLGWRNGFSVQELEQALSDIEKFLVSELIEEVFS